MHSLMRIVVNHGADLLRLGVVVEQQTRIGGHVDAPASLAALPAVDAPLGMGIRHLFEAVRDAQHAVPETNALRHRRLEALYRFARRRPQQQLDPLVRYTDTHRRTPIYALDI